MHASSKTKTKPKSCLIWRRRSDPIGLSRGWGVSLPEELEEEEGTGSLHLPQVRGWPGSTGKFSARQLKSGNINLPGWGRARGKGAGTKGSSQEVRALWGSRLMGVLSDGAVVISPPGVRKAGHRRKAMHGVLRAGLRTKWENVFPTRPNMNLPTQTHRLPPALRTRCRNPEEGRPVSSRGVWFAAEVQKDDNTMFLLFELFYPIFPAHKECTVVSTEPLCLCKLFWSKISVNYFPNHRTTRSCWENGLCRNAVNCFCHRRKYNQEKSLWMSHYEKGPKKLTFIGFFVFVRAREACGYGYVFIWILQPHLGLGSLEGFRSKQGQLLPWQVCRRWGKRELDFGTWYSGRCFAWLKDKGLCD